MDVWSEAVRREEESRRLAASTPYRGGDYPHAPTLAELTVEITEKPKDKNMEAKLYTVIALRNPSLLEQQQGVGVVILAGPVTIAASSGLAATAQFGAANADKIKSAPAGLLSVTVKEGL